MTVDEQMIFMQGFDVMAGHVHDVAVNHGWWDEKRNDGELICLMHSELSETLEALRRGDPESEKIPGFSCTEEELADAVLRIMDYAEDHNMNLGAAILAKCKYNEGRPYKHGKKF